jgi:hypothetical protein
MTVQLGWDEYWSVKDDAWKCQNRPGKQQDAAVHQQREIAEPPRGCGALDLMISQAQIA